MRKGLAVLLVLCLTAFVRPEVVNGATLSLSINDVNAGQLVAFQGTTVPGVLVPLKLVDAQGTIVYYDEVLADGTGHFSGIFAAPQYSGSLSIVSGSGTDVAKTSLIVRPTPTYPAGGNSGSEPLRRAQVKTNVKPVETAKSMPVFEDIDAHWAKSSIEKVFARGITGGYIDGTFKPDNQITRAELVVMLVKAFDIPSGIGKDFDDSLSHWAKQYISQGTASGFISGYNAKAFGPDDLVTREQMAVMITQAAKIKSGLVPLCFLDEKQISPWARDAVAISVGNNIVGGFPDHTFKPRGHATRAEVATVLANIVRS